MKLWITYFRAILAMFFWSITFVWYKVAYETYRPYEVVFLRLLLASILLFALMIVFKHWQKLEPKDLGRMVLVAFFEPFLYFIGEANGMQYVSSTLGSIIIATIPIFAAMGAWLLLKEKLSIYVIIGLILSFAGVAVLSLADGDFRATLKGMMFLMVAVFGAVGYGLTVRRLTLKYSTLSIVAYQSFFGMFFFLPLFLYYDGNHFLTIQHSTSGLYTIVAMCLCATIGAFMLYTDVIRTLGVAKSNIFTNLIPVFTVVLAFLMLGDPIGVKTVAGLILTILGLILSQHADLQKLRERMR